MSPRGLNTGIASTTEHQVIALNLMSTLPRSAHRELLVIGEVQVVDLATVLALKVAVGCGVAIKALHREGQTVELALVAQEIEVAVDGAKAQVRIAGLEPVVHHIGRGMFTARHDGLIDQLPLTGIALASHS